jgi:cell wall assembly regulator SMI1
MGRRVRRFETRGIRPPRWCNVILEGRRLTTVSGLISDGPPDWCTSKHGKKVSKDFPTGREATAAAAQKCRELAAKGYSELCRGRRAGVASDSLRAAWGRVEAWFCAYAPADCDFPLAAGAAEGELLRLERLIGRRLPSDFRASYRRHDGSNRVQIFDIFGLGYWMPLYRPGHRRWRFGSVADKWRFLTGILRDGGFDQAGSSHRPKGPIKAEHWNPGWVPFTCADTGDYLCLDLDPPPGGKRGQVIFWWHEWGPYTVVADSFGELVRRLAGRLAEGVYSFDVEPGMGERLGYGRPGDYSFDYLLKIFRAETGSRRTRRCS